MDWSRVGAVALGVVLGFGVILGSLLLTAEWGARKFQTAGLINPPIHFVPK